MDKLYITNRVPTSWIQTHTKGRVDYAVAELVPAVLLPSSRPHDGFSRKGCGGRIPCLPVERLSYLRVPSHAGVDVRVAVGLGQSRRVEGDVVAVNSLQGCPSRRADCKEKTR